MGICLGNIFVQSSFSSPFFPENQNYVFHTSQIWSLYLIGLNSIVDNNLLNWSSGDGDCSMLESIFTSVLISCQLFIPKKLLFLAINASYHLQTLFELKNWLIWGGLHTWYFLTVPDAPVTQWTAEPSAAGESKLARPGKLSEHRNIDTNIVYTAETGH